MVSKFITSSFSKSAQQQPSEGPCISAASKGKSFRTSFMPILQGLVGSTSQCFIFLAKKESNLSEKGDLSPFHQVILSLSTTMLTFHPHGKDRTNLLHKIVQNNTWFIQINKLGRLKKKHSYICSLVIWSWLDLYKHQHRSASVYKQHVSGLMKRFDSSIKGAQLQFIAVTSITIFEMWYVPRGSIYLNLSLFPPLWWPQRDGLLGGGAVWWSGRGADEALYFPRIYELMEQPGGTTARRCQSEALIDWRESLCQVCLQIDCDNIEGNHQNHHWGYFGLVALRWSHRQLYFSHIVAKHLLALRSRYSAETTWTSHTRGRVADVCSDHEWVSVFPENDPI